MRVRPERSLRSCLRCGHEERVHAHHHSATYCSHVYRPLNADSADPTNALYRCSCESFVGSAIAWWLMRRRRKLLHPTTGGS